MQIQMKQRELELAVRDYIAKCGIARPIGTISFTASRGDDGVVTEVEILAVEVSAEEDLAEDTTGSEATPKKRSPRKPKIVSVTETEPEPTETSGAPEAVSATDEVEAEAQVDDVVAAAAPAIPSGKSLFG